MNKNASILLRFANILNVLVKTIIIILGAAMFLVVVLQVFNRFVLNNPLFWTDEMATYLMIWAIFLACFYAYEEGSHVRVAFLVERFSPRTQEILSLSVNVLILVFLIATGLAGAEHARQYIGYKSPMMRMPRVVPYLSIPTGIFLMAGVTVRNIMQNLHALRVSYRRLEQE